MFKSQIPQLAGAPPPTPKPKPKRTAAQAAAARSNGSQSLGPITPAGKSTSSKNAIRHGLTASINTLLEAESNAEYDIVYDAWIDDLRPMTKAELRLVEKLSNIDWRLERLVMMETALLEIGLGAHQSDAHLRWKQIDEIGLLAEAWQGASDLSHGLDLLRRYLATLQNQFNAMLKNFRNLERGRLDPSRIRDSGFLPPYQRPQLFPLQKEPGDPQPISLQSPTHSQPSRTPASSAALDPRKRTYRRPNRLTGRDRPEAES